MPCRKPVAAAWVPYAPEHTAEKARTGHQDSGKGVPGPAPVWQARCGVEPAVASRSH